MLKLCMSLFLVLILSVLSFESAQALTKGELKQALAVLDAAGVPDSAAVKANGVGMGLSPINMMGPPIIETLDSEGHWSVSPGSPSLVSEINFPAP